MGPDQGKPVFPGVTRARVSGCKSAKSRGWVLTPWAHLTNHNDIEAGGQAGYAADCKSVKTGSIPVLASNDFSGLQKPVSEFFSEFRHSRFGLVPFRMEGPLPSVGSAILFLHTISCGQGLFCSRSERLNRRATVTRNRNLPHEQGRSRSLATPDSRPCRRPQIDTTR